MLWVTQTWVSDWCMSFLRYLRPSARGSRRRFAFRGAVLHNADAAVKGIRGGLNEFVHFGAKKGKLFSPDANLPPSHWKNEQKLFFNGLPAIQISSHAQKIRALKPSRVILKLSNRLPYNTLHYCGILAAKCRNRRVTRARTPTRVSRCGHL